MKSRSNWTRIETVNKSELSFENQYGEKLGVAFDNFIIKKLNCAYCFGDLSRYTALRDKYSAMQVDGVIFFDNKDKNLFMIRCEVNPEKINVVWRLVEAIASEEDIADIKPQIREFLGLPKELDQAPELPPNNNEQETAELEKLKQTIMEHTRLITELTKELNALRSEVQFQQAINAPPVQLLAPPSPKMFK